MKAVRKAKPSSVNLSLVAIDNFYLFLGMGRPEVWREELVQAAPRSLYAEEQKRFLRAVERSYQFILEELVAERGMRLPQDPSEINDYELLVPEAEF